MLRSIATALLAAQLTALAGPALVGCPVHDGHSPVEHVRVDHDVISDGPADCEGCDLPDCQSMLGCASAGPAVLSVAHLNFVSSLVPAEIDDPPSWPDHGVGPPVSPPPKA